MLGNFSQYFIAKEVGKLESSTKLKFDFRIIVYLKENNKAQVR